MQGVKNIIGQGESINVEFKECKSELGKNVFETVCAFLNTNGGEILLVVKNKGEITGIDENHTEKIKKDFVTAMNNSEKINSSFYLSIEEFNIGKSEEDIFKTLIPLTPQVTMQAAEQTERTKKISIFCKTPKSRQEIMKFLKLKDREHFRVNILYPLIEQGLLHPTLPEKLTSPKQKYYYNITKKT